MEKSKIIILRGNSGSGKTTVAKNLQKKLGQGTLLISQDVVRREMLWVKDGSDTKTLSLLMELVRYGKENCEFVILEGILNASWYRELFALIQYEFGEDIYAYYYDLPFEETLIRHETKPNHNDFGENEMREWWMEKDYINSIKETTIRQDLSLPDTVNMILRDVGIN